MLRRIYYIVDEAFRTVRRHKGLTSISIVIMSLSLLMLAVFLLATDNALRLVSEAQNEMKMYVYLKDGVSENSAEGLYQKILSQPEVSEVRFVSKDEAMQDFREQLGDDSDLLSTLRTNPLPNSFWVTPKEEFKTRDAMVDLAGRIEPLAGVEEVRYGREFLERFASVLKALYFVSAVVGFIVILSALFIISNAVRLTVISRRKTIEILKLVGATNPYIVAPFIIEGAFQAGIAAVLSLALLFGIAVLSRGVIPDLTFFSPEKSVVYLITCVVIGSMGSFFALRRMLQMR
ncbi:MAG TPA: permease-like cell division protein FtsX [Candidatus Krumholzibacteria bacterium]|nr:permease-like cell division protein FtsX [Candidatus Krumholzibacteria bacterium]